MTFAGVAKPDKQFDGKFKQLPLGMITLQSVRVDSGAQIAINQKVSMAKLYNSQVLEAV